MARIHEQIGPAVLPKEQRLFFDGIELASKRTLASYRLDHESTLNMVPTFVEMYIFVKTIHDETITLDVQATDLIGDIMLKLQNAGAISYLAGQHRLFFGDTHLARRRTFGSYNIVEGSTLQLQEFVHGDMRIFVQTPAESHVAWGESIALDVKASDTVANVKVAIEDRRGYHADTLSLRFDGAESSDQLKLHDCGIEDQSVLDVLIYKPPKERCEECGHRFPCLCQTMS